MNHVLLLNATYEPLSAIKIERAMILLTNNKAELVHAHPEKKIRTVQKEFSWPEVIRLKFFVRVKRRELSPSKRNIMERDAYTCQYCGTSENLTIDHVLPVSRGGKNTWGNMITCCWKCNNEKNNRTPEEWGTLPMTNPGRPNHLSVMKIYSRDKKLKSWEDYIFIK